MTSHAAAFSTYEVISPRNVHLGNDSMAEAIGMGCIVVRVEMRGKLYIICITNVLQVPKLQANLLSVNKLLWNGLRKRLNVNECIVGGVNGDVATIARRGKKMDQIIFTKVMWSEYGQLHVFTCPRQFGGALAPLTRPFECEEYLCPPKHGEGHEHR